MKTIRRLPLVVAIGAALALPVHAQSLIELYESARGYDASYQSAKSQYDATLAKAEQSRSLILPTANLGINAERVNEQHDPTSLPGYNRTFSDDSISITASQPLYRPANWATYKQGQRQLDLAQVQLTIANQDLIVRVSQAYFDLLASQDALTYVKAQKAAVAEQLASAKRNFEVGTATITDTREAQARHDLVVAQEIAGENDLRVKRLALDQLVGRSNVQPNPLAQPLTLPALVPNDVDAWVKQGETASPGIMQAQIAMDVAQLETQKAQAGHKPTLDLTAQLINSNNL
ncbi:MAG TPA: TolC family protein, partial [Rhodoferax sp.]|nr:TolC family protein [Rhodoferax sp.]